MGLLFLCTIFTYYSGIYRYTHSVHESDIHHNNISRLLYWLCDRPWISWAVTYKFLHAVFHRNFVAMPTFRKNSNHCSERGKIESNWKLNEWVRWSEPKSQQQYCKFLFSMHLTLFDVLQNWCPAKLHKHFGGRKADFEWNSIFFHIPIRYLPKERELTWEFNWIDKWLVCVYACCIAQNIKIGVWEKEICKKKLEKDENWKYGAVAAWLVSTLPLHLYLRILKSIYVFMVM